MTILDRNDTEILYFRVADQPPKVGSDCIKHMPTVGHENENDHQQQQSVVLFSVV